MAGKKNQPAAGGHHAADRHATPASGTPVAAGGPVVAGKPAPNADLAKPDAKQSDAANAVGGQTVMHVVEPGAQVGGKDSANEAPKPPAEPAEELPAVNSATPAPELPSMRQSIDLRASRLKEDDWLRCQSFTYLGATYDVRARVVATEDGALLKALVGEIEPNHPKAEWLEGAALLEIPALKTFWLISIKRVVFASGPGGIVGTWQHVEADYPSVGKDPEFDKRFRAAQGGENMVPVKPQWKPPRAARAGHVWVLSKTALHCNCFDVEGNSLKKVPANKHVEVSSRVVEDSRSAFEDV